MFLIRLRIFKIFGFWLFLKIKTRFTAPFLLGKKGTALDLRRSFQRTPSPHFPTSRAALWVFPAARSRNRHPDAISSLDCPHAYTIPQRTFEEHLKSMYQFLPLATTGRAWKRGLDLFVGLDVGVPSLGELLLSGHPLIDEFFMSDYSPI